MISSRLRPEKELVIHNYEVIGPTEWVFQNIRYGGSGRGGVSILKAQILNVALHPIGKLAEADP